MPTAIFPRLLIADDDPNLLAAYLLFFETCGYEIRTAADGPHALREYRAWHPHAVVLDIQMPGMDGCAVAKEIRRLQPGVATLLIAVTALWLPSDRAASVRAGFNHHFVKPVKLPALGARLTRHFRTGEAFR
ncbi:response regulator [Paraburkholderia aromaticivorans]|uniref:response regulator n=1 Tax=Paraburkholderia aromaticivorans TaxID=2026199 RepID=UPI0014560BB3|nr:response regulator [Paraburkholderia aromaticivorans]